MPRRSLSLILAVVVISLACYDRASHNPYGRWFAEIFARISDDFVEPVDEQKLFEGALKGMVDRLDDYSKFLPRNEKARFDEALDQHYVGIGIEVGPHLTVTNTLAGTPAANAGIRRGDKIIAVNNRDTQGMKLEDLITLLRGKPGDGVEVRVSRPDREQPLDFHLVRAQIKTDSVLGDVRQPDGAWNFFLPGDERIGYLRITSFGQSTVSECAAALKWLGERNCRGLVLDLRGNPGGLLQAGEEVCELFLPKDTLIVTTRGRNGREQARFVAAVDGPYQHLPLVILVNDKTASAGEIVAACLQDHERATIVGQRTWGKGTVQNIIPVEDGQSSLKLTIASYWRPNGQNIHRLSTSKDSDPWGVHPNPGGEVAWNEEQTTAWQEKRHERDLTSAADSAAPDDAKESASSPLGFDQQLQRAVQLLQEKLAKVEARSS